MLLRRKNFAYEKVKGAPQEEKLANTYSTIAKRIVGTKGTKRMNIGQNPLLVMIKPKNQEKSKTLEEAKKYFCKKPSA